MMQHRVDDLSAPSVLAGVNETTPVVTEHPAHCTRLGEREQPPGGRVGPGLDRGAPVQGGVVLACRGIEPGD
jgi:hypothetical protein